MKNQYNLEWLLEQDTKRFSIQYLYFWGHTPKKQGITDKSCFSQWFQSGFILDGVEYKTAEHWMMAGKARLFGDFEIEKEIIREIEPSNVKKLGRLIRNYNEEIWIENRFEIVVKGNFHKFSQNLKLKNFLLSTGEKVIVEASPYDNIWGIGLGANSEGIYNPDNWKGLNLLGFALMEVRDQLETKN